MSIRPITTSLPSSPGRAIRAAGRAVARWFEGYARARSRAGVIERLGTKSDAELAAMGLRREDIARHVFRDVLHPA